MCRQVLASCPHCGEQTPVWSGEHVKPAVGADARGRSVAGRGHLLGVGPVPEDGVAVCHHFGAGLLAKNTHQQHQADKQDHFHLQHHYSKSSARIPLRCRSVSRVLRALLAGQVSRLVHMWPSVCGAVWTNTKVHNVESSKGKSETESIHTSGDTCSGCQKGKVTKPTRHCVSSLVWGDAPGGS